MDKQIVSGPGLPTAIGPYSIGIESDGWVFVSGQIPIDPASGEIVPGGVPEQTRRVLENLKNVLAAAGCDTSRVVKTTVFMTDLAAFPQMNEIYAEYFHAPHPARSTIQVAALPKGALVEIEAVAYRD